MKASKKEMILSVVLCLLPILLGLFLWKELPEQVPTHFGLNNEPDGYSSKAFAVFGLPAIMAALDVLCLFGLKSDPKADKHGTVLAKMMLYFIPGLSILVCSLCLMIAVGKNINLALIIQLFIGVLFIVVGNYLPKCRQNYTMGIKLPWTLNDEDNWNYTHRLGGFVWVIAGLVQIVNAFIGSPWVFFGVVFVAAFIPMIASYIYYRKHKTE